MNTNKSICLNGINLNYSDEGNGQPVLFIHGFASHSVTWNKLIPCLPKRKRYITIDLKGFGLSDKPADNKYSAYEQAILVIDFIHALKLKNIVLAGHSYGVFIALLMVLLPQMQSTVSALILIDSVGYFQNIPAFIATLRIPILSKIALDALNPELLAKTVLEKVYYDKSKITHELIDDYAKVLYTEGAKLSLVKSAESFVSGIIKSVHQEFTSITTPTLIIWGIDDLFIPVVNSYQFRHDLQKAELAVIPECGHSPQEECPEETAKFITQFLNNLS